MTDNEKVAIVARLWESGKVIGHTFDHAPVYREAPDMHDPANLWRALENIAALLVVGKNPQTGNWVCSLVLRQHQSKFTHFECPRLADAIFAALVALYDAEHKA